MKKLNNKDFAISTISSSKTANDDFIDEIEKELNASIIH